VNRISIITPVRNGSAEIVECVENVAAQASGALEHVLVIDARSGDDSVARAEALARAHPHVRMVTQSAGGQSTALNLGVASASAAALGILNVDDRYLPGAIAHGVAALERVPAPGFVYGRCRVCDGGGALLSINAPVDPRLVAMIATHDFPCNPAAYFYHRALHELVGGYADDDEHSMDKDFIFRVAARVELHRVDEDWGVFRLAPGTKTFEAMRSGELRRRARRFRLRHFRALSWRDRLRCAALYAGFKLRHLSAPRVG